MKRVAGVEPSILPEKMVPPATLHVKAGEGERGSSRVESQVAPGHEPDGSRTEVGISAPAFTTLPWACVTCGGWVPPVERIYTDEGLFHDRLSCLSEKTFDELVTRYGCRCDA